MEAMKPAEIAGVTMLDYSMLYHLKTGGLKMTVAEDGAVYAGSCKVANSEPANTEVSAMLSNNAQKVFEVIKTAGGGIIDEYKILNRADLSHGSFSAARKELIDAGLLSLDKDGRKTVYIVNADTSSKTTISGTSFDTSKSDVKPPAPPPSPLSSPLPRSSARPPVRRQPKALASVSVSKMPRVTGEFTDIDEWEDALISRIGGCVDISQIDDTHYEVTAYDLDETARYTVIDDGESITVS